MHDSMGTQYKKFHLHVVEDKLKEKNNKVIFALKSGVFFDTKGFLIIGDSMDHLYIPYQLDSSLTKYLLKAEGHILYYQTGDDVKKMTLSVKEMAFLFEYVELCEEWIQPWDWEGLDEEFQETWVA